ncbi:MAG: amidohydrolase family protein [Acetobacteraceae bacterium]|jgi:cytosine/adenosine deaminase-related metal-dependent hydrolase|nr:amidohydrolase family protein [Acetobacteraceae bacterium]
MTDILIRGGTVVAMDEARRVIEDGAVAITGDRIAAVGPRAEVEAAHGKAGTVIEAKGRAILPGLIDGHAHAGHALVKTMGGGDSAAWSEACRIIYTTASPPSFWRAEARLAALERLKNGVTTGVSLLGGGDSIMRVDDPAHGEAHAAGVGEIGIRAIVAVGPTRPPHPRPYASWDGPRRTDYPVSFEQQAEVIGTLIERLHGAQQGRLSIATLMPVYREAKHDPAQVALIERQGRIVRDLGRKAGTLFHQDGHQKGSIAMAERMFGLNGPDAFYSHCTDLTEEDIDSAARTGVSIVHNPTAIAQVRGHCPVPLLLDRGVTVMIGSDGTAPDRGTDMFRHMVMCARLHQRAARDERLMPPGKLLEMITTDAAKGLGMAGQIGSLEAGKKADVITVDLATPHAYPPNMPVHRLVFFAGGADVRDVVVDGRVLMRERVVAGVDEAEILAQAAAETEVMLDRSGLRALIACDPGWGRVRL